MSSNLTDISNFLLSRALTISFAVHAVLDEWYRYTVCPHRVSRLDCDDKARFLRSFSSSFSSHSPFESSSQRPTKTGSTASELHIRSKCSSNGSLVAPESVLLPMNSSSRQSFDRFLLTLREGFGGVETDLISCYVSTLSCKASAVLPPTSDPA